MRTFRIRTHAVLAAAFAALAGTAQAAAAQDLAPLTGTPVAYQVGMPVPAWELLRNDEEMMQVGTADAVIIASAWDLLAQEQRNPAIPDHIHRTIVTNQWMDSDSLLMARVAEALSSTGNLQAEGRVEEMRTLGGERAAYMRTQWEREGDTGWAQAYVTVKDGIMYMLVHVVAGADADKYGEIFGRVHQSFVLAAAPPAS